jgi:ABC-type transport system involved in cytochrome c biogenesis permease subunit
MDASILIGLMVIAVAVIAFVLYVWALVNAARNAKWLWFVLVLLFGPLCVVYLLLAYERAPSRKPQRKVEPTIR